MVSVLHFQTPLRLACGCALRAIDVSAHYNVPPSVSAAACPAHRVDGSPAMADAQLLTLGAVAMELHHRAQALAWLCGLPALWQRSTANGEDCSE